MNLADDIETLKGVGPAVAVKLRILGVKTVEDLIEFYPRRYDDYSKVVKIKDLKPGNVVSIKARLVQSNGRYARRGLHITEAVVSDSTDSVRLVWFNQPYRASALKKGQEYFITGSFELSNRRLGIMNPSMELVSDFPINTARIVPVYRQTKGLKSSTIRKIVASLAEQIDTLPEPLPASTVASKQLISRARAITNIHFPSKMSDIDLAKTRLSFDELFAISLAALLNKQQFEKESGVLIPFNENLAKEFTASLPFKLTNAQRRVIWQIYQDFQAKHPANRLVQGDVGSGKTVVAVMCAIMAMRAGYQVALMAPTEILARQHAENIEKMLKNTEFSDQTALLISAIKPTAKKLVQSKIKSAEVKLIIGTHALITDNVDLHNLGLVIIDEQHRFGVEQRQTLMKKAGRAVHVISMTATPIPRSLALTLYGELDTAILDEMPPGREPVATKVVSPNSKKQMYEEIKLQINKGHQAFFVCPLIEESDVLNVLSAEEVYKELSTKIFKDYRVELLHGKLKSEQKDQIMASFVDGKVDILVATTVIEVGVDVPNATVMVIEGIERFGLAQAHQLRGRVGRGKAEGYCYLVMSDSSEPTRRIRALESTSDGFKLAELDLKIRGPGAIYGHMQSGDLDLRVADLSDMRQIANIRASAEQFIESGEKLSRYKTLEKQVNSYRSVTNLN